MIPLLKNNTQKTCIYFLKQCSSLWLQLSGRNSIQKHLFAVRAGNPKVKVGNTSKSGKE